MEDMVDDLLARWGKAKSDRATLDDTWEECARYYLPERAGFTSHIAQGEDRHEYVYDGEQIEAVDALAAFIETSMMPHEEPWLDMQTRERVEENDDEAKLWLAHASERMRHYIYDPAAGFQNTLWQAFLDLVVFGPGAFFIGENRDLTGLLFRSMHLKNLHWCRDEARNVDVCFLREELTLRQASQRWGIDNLSDDSRRALQDARSGQLERKVDFLQIVLPRTDYRPRSPFAKDKPFASYVIEVAPKHKVNESGFDEFPFIVAEWQILDEDIWSPGRRGLPDVRQLQQQAKTILQAGQLSVHPPIMIPSDGIFEPLNLVAGGVTQYDPSTLQQSGARSLVERLDIGGNMPLGLDMQERQREKVAAVFLRPLLQLPDRANMTATEVLRRGSDFVKRTASMFGRLQTRLTQPMVERVFAILMRQSLSRQFGPGSPFAPPPESIRGANANFKLYSPVAKAQREAEVASLAHFLDVMVPVWQLQQASGKPSSSDHIDFDAITRAFMETGISPKYLKAVDTVLEGRQAQQQAQQQAAQQQAVGEAAQAAGRAAPALRAAKEIAA